MENRRLGLFKSSLFESHEPEDDFEDDVDYYVGESVDTEYWKQYNDDTSGMRGNANFGVKSEDFEDTFSEAVSDWNMEAEDAENRIKGSQIQNIKKLAREFFKKERWISVNIIQAMISQES